VWCHLGSRPDGCVVEPGSAARARALSRPTGLAFEFQRFLRRVLEAFFCLHLQQPSERIKVSITRPFEAWWQGGPCNCVTC